MLLGVVFIVAGLLLLYYGAEYLVTGSSRLALSLGVRPLVVGLTVVAIATSMPEFMVSLLAATRGASAMAAGNVVGSNIANIGLILGVAGLLATVSVSRATLLREVPIMIVASLGGYLAARDGLISFGEGAALFAGLLGFLAYCLVTARDLPGLPDGENGSARALSAPSGRLRSSALILVGMVGLGVGADLMVRGAVTVATLLGVSEVVIGLSVVALGTSLPELAATLVSAWRGEMDISVGNIIGSNIFNVLFVLGVCPMVHPITVEARLLSFDFPVMLGFCALLVALLVLPPGLRLDRRRGALLLGGYALFLASLFR